MLPLILMRLLLLLLLLLLFPFLVLLLVLFLFLFLFLFLVLFLSAAALSNVNRAGMPILFAILPSGIAILLVQECDKSHESHNNY